MIVLWSRAPLKLLVEYLVVVLQLSLVPLVVVIVQSFQNIIQFGARWHIQSQTSESFAERGTGMVNGVRRYLEKRRSKKLTHMIICAMITATAAQAIKGIRLPMKSHEPNEVDSLAGLKDQKESYEETENYERN